MQTNRNSSARRAYVAAADELQLASLWLGAGAAAIRTGDALAADRYLRLATVRCPHDSRIYALLALIHVADSALSQLDSVKILNCAIELGLEESGLLRELGNAYFEFEQHGAAEALLRRAAVTEPKKGAYAHAVKRLADVIAVHDMCTRPV